LLSGFFSGKTELPQSPESIRFGGELSNSTRRITPKAFPSVSKITVSVFAWPSYRQWNSKEPKQSRMPRQSSKKTLFFRICEDLWKVRNDFSIRSAGIQIQCPDFATQFSEVPEKSIDHPEHLAEGGHLRRKANEIFAELFQ
jgi:hypothetical protein